MFKSKHNRFLNLLDSSLHIAMPWIRQHPFNKTIPISISVTQFPGNLLLTYFICFFYYLLCSKIPSTSQPNTQCVSVKITKTEWVSFFINMKMNFSLSHPSLAPITLFHLTKASHKSLWVTPTTLSKFPRAKPNQATHTYPLILKAKISANHHPN